MSVFVWVNNKWELNSRHSNNNINSSSRNRNFSTARGYQRDKHPSRCAQSVGDRRYLAYSVQQLAVSARAKLRETTWRCRGCSQRKRQVHFYMLRRLQCESAQKRFLTFVDHIAWRRFQELSWWCRAARIQRYGTLPLKSLELNMLAFKLSLHMRSPRDILRRIK